MGDGEVAGEDKGAIWLSLHLTHERFVYYIEGSFVDRRQTLFQSGNMAIVRKLEFQPLQVEAAHTETTATYSIVLGPKGEKYLQIDTYGSIKRKVLGKKSQSIRLAPDALIQIRTILDMHF